MLSHAMRPLVSRRLCIWFACAANLLILGRLRVDEVLLLENEQDAPAEDLEDPAETRDLVAEPDTQDAARQPDCGDERAA